LELWDKAAKMYEEQSRLEEVAELYANMGPIAAATGDIPRGIRFSRKAEELAAHLEPDPELVYHVSSDLGAMYAELGDWEKAMYEDSRALEVSRATDNCAGQINALLALAQVSLARQDLVSARSEAMGAFSLAHSCSDSLLEAEAMRAVGDVSEAAGEHEQAIRQYEQGAGSRGEVTRSRDTGAAPLRHERGVRRHGRRGEGGTGTESGRSGRAPGGRGG